MKLDQWAAIATIIQAIFVIVSVLFIWYELRRSNRLTKAANVETLVGLSSPFNLQLIQDRGMAELWLNGTNQYDDMDEIDQFRYRALLTWWLILHENIFYQYQHGLIDKNAYGPWSQDLKRFVSSKNLGQHWSEMRTLYQNEFAEHVNRILNEPM